MNNDSIQLEKVVLGEILMAPEMVSDLDFRMLEDMFERSVHRQIFRAIQQLESEGRTVDLVTLAVDRTRLGLGEDIAVILSDIAATATGTYHFSTHARLLREAYCQRVLTTLGTELQSPKAHTSEEIIAMVEERIYALTDETTISAPTAVADDVDLVARRLADASASGKAVTGIQTGFERLDKMTLGLHGSELIILAARPAQGKSAMALTIARNIAERQVPIAIFSLEMGRAQLMDRLLMQMANLPGDKVRGGVLNSDELWQANTALERIRRLPIFVDDTAGLSTIQLSQRVRKLVRRHGVQIVIIDYLQLMTTPISSHASRENEVAKISRTLKALAQELHVPIIALSQLNREMERGAEVREPRLSDLRESGAIEQDADVVLMLHDSVHKHFPDERMLIVAKQRNGATGNILLRFRAEIAKFE